jgi:hypothetical protein
LAFLASRNSSSLADCELAAETDSAGLIGRVTRVATAVRRVGNAEASGSSVAELDCLF